MSGSGQALDPARNRNLAILRASYAARRTLTLMSNSATRAIRRLIEARRGGIAPIELARARVFLAIRVSRARSANRLSKRGEEDGLLRISAIEAAVVAMGGRIEMQWSDE